MKPKIDDIKNIAKSLTKEFQLEDLPNITVSIVVDEGYLKKLNEELFYRHSSGGKYNDSDEIILNVDGIAFKFEEKRETV